MSVRKQEPNADTDQAPTQLWQAGALILLIAALIAAVMLISLGGGVSGVTRASATKPDSGAAKQSDGPNKEPGSGPSQEPAGDLVYSDCGEAKILRPFADWGDRADYVAVDNGSFDYGLEGWTVKSKFDWAAVVTANTVGSEPGAVLRLQKAARLISPPICFDETRPHAKMFARLVKNQKGKLKDGKVKVKVRYATLPKGKIRTIKIGTIRRKRGEPGVKRWSPTPEIGTGLGGARKRTMPDENGRRWFQFEFKNKGDGSWQLDDLYVDPRRRN